MIEQGLTTSFKYDLLTGAQQPLTDVLFMALYVATANIGPDTVVYTPEGETSGLGYYAGGRYIDGVTVSVDPQTGVAYMNFNNVSWISGATSFIARGALIYNRSRDNRTVAVLDFGADKEFADYAATVIMPPNGPTTALIRLP